MARQPRKRSGSRTPDMTDGRTSPPAEDRAGEIQPEMTGPGTTGRFLVLLREDADAGAAMLSRVSGLRVASAADFEAGAAPEDLGGADAVVLPELGICVVDAQPDQIRALGASVEDTGVLAIEPERVVYAIQDGPAVQTGLLGSVPESGTASISLEYLRGYRDAVNHLYDKLTGTEAGEVAAEAAPAFSETELTWGLQATKVPGSRFTVTTQAPTFCDGMAYRALAIFSRTGRRAWCWRVPGRTRPGRTLRRSSRSVRRVRGGWDWLGWPASPHSPRHRRNPLADSCAFQ